MRKNYIFIALFAILIGFSLAVSPIIGILLVVLTCGVAILAVDYEIAVYIVAFYSIIDYVIRKIVNCPWDDAYLVLLLLLIIYKWIAYRKTTKFKWSPLDIPIFIYVLINLLCIVVHPYEMNIVIAGFRDNVEYIFWFFGCFQLIKGKISVRRIYFLLVLTVFLISIYGIYQYIVKTPMPSGWVDSSEKGVATRAFSIIGSPNILGSLLAMVSPLVVGLFITEKKLFVKVIYIFIYLSMILCLVVTYSRGAWVVFALGICVYIILKDVRLIIPAIIIGILIFICVPSVSARITYMLSPEYIQSSLRGGRLVRWATGFNMIQKQPFFGVGLGHFGGAVAVNHHISGNFYMDNYYLKIAVEIGLVGFSFFTALMYLVGKWTFLGINRVKDKMSKELITAGFVGILSIILHNFVENIFEVPMMVCYFWLIVACVLSLWFVDENSYAAEKKIKILK